MFIVAEKNFQALTSISQQHPELHCVAVSHSTQQGTDNWIMQVGGSWNASVVVDTDRDVYAAWGLGMGSVWGTLGPSVLWSAYQLGKQHNIWNRPTEVGTRWQNSGLFAVDADGVVRFVHPDATPDDFPDMDKAMAAVGVAAKGKQ